MIYKYIGRHQMNRRSYLRLYVYDNSKEFKIGIAGFSIYGTKSENLGGSSRNFFSPPKLKMPPRALVLLIHILTFWIPISTYIVGPNHLYFIIEARSQSRQKWRKWRRNPVNVLTEICSHQRSIPKWFSLIYLCISF